MKYGKTNGEVLHAKRTSNNLYKLLWKIMVGEGSSQIEIGETNLSESRWNSQRKSQILNGSLCAFTNNFERKVNVCFIGKHEYIGGLEFVGIFLNRGGVW